MQKFELVVAGGGLAAARAIKSYRESGGRGQIALLSKESDLPYHRPALSKRYLRSETADAPFAEDAAFYRDHDVEVLLETTVTGVDAGSRTVATDGGTFQYNKLLIAAGATPRRLDVSGAELEGVYALRMLQDSQAIREQAGRPAASVPSPPSRSSSVTSGSGAGAPSGPTAPHRRPRSPRRRRRASRYCGRAAHIAAQAAGTSIASRPSSHVVAAR